MKTSSTQARVIAFLTFLLLQQLSFAQTEDQLGFVVIESNYEEFYIVVDNDFSNAAWISSGDTLSVPLGERMFTLVPETSDPLKVLAKVTADDIKTYKVMFKYVLERPSAAFQRIIKQINLIVRTGDETLIFLDDELYGTGSITTEWESDEVIVRLEHPIHGSVSNIISIPNDRIFTYELYLTPPSINTVTYFVPGWASFSNERPKKALLSLGSVLVSASALFITENQFQSKLVSYRDAVDVYESTTTELDAIRARNQALSLNQDLNNLRNFRRVFIATTVGIYAVTTYLGFQKPKGGFKSNYGEKKLNATISPKLLMTEQQSMHPGIQLKVSF